MNEVMNNLKNLCHEQNINVTDTENLTKYIKYITYFLPKNSPTRQEAFTHEGSSYYVLSFPLVDLFENPWDENNIKLSAALKIASSRLNMTVRYQNQGSFSGLTLRFKL